jgi:hypothetical protein
MVLSMPGSVPTDFATATPPTTSASTSTSTPPPLTKRLLTHDDLTYLHHVHPFFARRLLPFLQRLDLAVRNTRTTDTAIHRSAFVERVRVACLEWLYALPDQLFMSKEESSTPAEQQAEAPSATAPAPASATPPAPAISPASAPTNAAISRFGNPAFRQFYDEAQRMAPTLLTRCTGDAWAQADPQAIAEMAHYLVASFGDRQRIDYGTGHELNFLCLL